MLTLATLALSDASHNFKVRTDLRTDGVPTILNYDMATFERLLRDGESYPFKPFSDAYVKKALADPVDWVKKAPSYTPTMAPCVVPGNQSSI